jgi:hypothetical protein
MNFQKNNEHSNSVK